MTKLSCLFSLPLSYQPILPIPPNSSNCAQFYFSYSVLYFFLQKDVNSKSPFSVFYTSFKSCETYISYFAMDYRNGRGRLKSMRAWFYINPEYRSLKHRKGKSWAALGNHSGCVDTPKHNFMTSHRPEPGCFGQQTCCWNMPSGDRDTSSMLYYHLSISQEELESALFL